MENKTSGIHVFDMNNRWKKYVQIIIGISIIFSQCTRLDEQSKARQATINFTDTVKINYELSAAGRSSGSLRIAVAAITSPRETFNFYREIFDHIEQKLGMRLQLVHRKTYEEINTLMKNNDVDIAFICSGGYVYGYADSAYNLLAIPERDGKRYYQAYIITHKSSNIINLLDLRGKKFAYTDPLSTTGKL